MNTESDVESWLRRKFKTQISSASLVIKDDLSLPNHLVYLEKEPNKHKRKLIKLSFLNENQHQHVKRELLKIANKNSKSKLPESSYEEMYITY
jgi:ribosomal protein L35